MEDSTPDSEALSTDELIVPANEVTEPEVSLPATEAEPANDEAAVAEKAAEPEGNTGTADRSAGFQDLERAMKDAAAAYQERLRKKDPS